MLQEYKFGSDAADAARRSNKDQSDRRLENQQYAGDCVSLRPEMRVDRQIETERFESSDEVEEACQEFLDSKPKEWFK
ncbi:hypothetical protein KIN20_003850 [Parelaphostrongylus tenuis]|uniref:Uncharacterized protein n=1 Tax=Parelaphostrongylus tenuis TaxID=148309 RepID=A0AAD5LZS4_PARTN|nr:hypothetical protein KIN20_003850 [Parelaphostrongylus tenuis]